MAPFGETVLAWRLHRGLTQAELAANARMSRPNLSAVERGDREVTLSTLRKLALALEVTPGTLADGTLPGQSARSLARKDLERIADAALSGARLQDSRQEARARQLASVTMAGKHRLAPRRSERAWLLLKAAEPPQVVVSALDRIRDRILMKSTSRGPGGQLAKRKSGPSASARRQT